MVFAAALLAYQAAAHVETKVITITNEGFSPHEVTTNTNAEQRRGGALAGERLPPHPRRVPSGAGVPALLVRGFSAVARS
ncbi:MAG: hypothetical protein Q8R32_01685 [bacterium]|nr:hypothetical protein [bacterium]